MTYEKIKMFPTHRCEIRYSLIKNGENMLIVVGFNPSTADDKIIDNTMRFVLKIAKYNGYDGFAMINLYPLRSTNPNQLPVEMDRNIVTENFRHINHLLSRYPKADILLAYGNLVEKRTYTKEISKQLLDVFKNNQRNILCLTKLKSGNPKHPLYTPYNTKLQRYFN